jgi:hypothetical protein
MSETDGSSGPPPQCNFITAYSQGACHEAIIQYGDNGDGSTPELLMNGAQTQFTWQATKVVNFYGNASIQMDVTPSGATLTAAKNQQIKSAADNSKTHQYITAVEIGAAVIAVPKRMMSWSGLAIKFYRGNELREAIPLESACNPWADTNTPSGGPAFKAVRHQPTNGDNDRVVVTGTITLQGNRGDPNFEFSPSDFYAKILVFTTGCTQQ